MYIVRSEITNKKWETTDLEDLLSNLEIENIHARRGNTTDKLIIFQTDNEGEIINEINLELPTEEVIDDLFLEFSKANAETLTKLKSKDEIDDMTVEEREIFNKINSQNDTQKNSNQARQKIIDKLNENRRKEEAEEKRKQEELKLREQQRLEERKVEELRVREQHRVQTSKEQYQAPISYDTRDSQPTVYQATTILSVKDLTNNFKQQTLDEVEKIDRQIYILEREKRKYQALIRAMEEI